ncbi:SH3 domain-containing protein [Yoonia algicola]|uniref:SH3 domain-containing protein n=1 Tax=Yoonia algicola TaxID=3137368 RepID=A0AAN0NH81_9RHOB
MAVSQTTPALNAFDGTLPLSGEYTVAISMMHSGARRDEISDYTLTISISGGKGAIVQKDYADGLQGGPDFYLVVTAGGSLNLRADPSTGAERLARLSNGQNLQNRGCRMAEGRRWCKDATLADPGIEGWAAGDFLIEGSGAETAPPRP